MIRTITLLGSSSGRNAGDAALLSGIMDSIDQSLEHRTLFEIPTIRPEFIWRSYENRVRPISMLPWHLSVKMLGLPTYQSILRSDLTLVFDAILFDRQLYNPLFNFLSTLAVLLPIAKRRGKKLGLFNVGAGPVHTPQGQKMLREVCELADFITVRDEDSRTLLREIGVSNPRLLVTADSALTVQGSGMTRAKEIISQAGLDPQKDILGINLSAYLDTWAKEQQALSKGSQTAPESIGRERFIKIAAQALDQVVRQLGVQLLFICTQHHDVSVTRDLMNAVTAQCTKGIVSNQNLSHYDIKAVLGAINLLFGMRLHATILSCASLTPTVALPHQPKVRHFFKSLGLEEFVMGFEDFEVDSLTRHILFGWDQRGVIRSRLQERIPELQAKSLQAAKLVAALSRGEDVDLSLQSIEGNKSTKVSNTESAVLREVSGLLG